VIISPCPIDGAAVATAGAKGNRRRSWSRRPSLIPWITLAESWTAAVSTTPWPLLPRCGSPPRLRPHTLVASVNPVPKPSYPPGTGNPTRSELCGERRLAMENVWNSRLRVWSVARRFAGTQWCDELLECSRSCRDGKLVAQGKDLPAEFKDGMAHTALATHSASSEEIRTAKPGNSREWTTSSSRRSAAVV